MEEEEKKEEEYFPTLSKLEEDYMKRVKENYKKNLIQKQIVAGREFKGTAFIAKPDVILFNDFELGRTYRQKILVTNASFSFNSFKLLPITDAFKDFFEIIYSPSGRMSAGLSTTIEIIFTPQLNSDIITSLPLLAETGPINIPLKCYCKKGIVKAEKSELDFGSVIYGEEGKVKLVLRNSGALSVNFEICGAGGEKLVLPRPVRLAPAQLAENLLYDREEALYPKVNEEVEKVEVRPEEDKPEEVQVEERKVEEKKTDEKKVEDKKKPEVSEPEPIKEQPIPQEPEEPKVPGYDFLSQINFSKSGTIKGYSTQTITFTFIPIALGTHQVQLLVKLSNEQYSPSFVITLQYVLGAYWIEENV